MPLLPSVLFTEFIDETLKHDSGSHRRSDTVGIEGRIDFCDIERVNLVVHLIGHSHALEQQKPERFVSAGTRNKCRVHPSISKVR